MNDLALEWWSGQMALAGVDWWCWMRAMLDSEMNRKAGAWCTTNSRTAAVLGKAAVAKQAPS